jgi:hypothetical protein
MCVISLLTYSKKKWTSLKQTLHSLAKTSFMSTENTILNSLGVLVKRFVLLGAHYLSIASCRHIFPCWRMSLIKVNFHHVKCLMWIKPEWLLKWNQVRFVINVGRSTYDGLLRQRVMFVKYSAVQCISAELNIIPLIIFP